MRIWKIPDQVVRLAIIFALLAAGVIAVRNQFIPESFGVEGHYRGQAVVDAAELQTRYAGAQACIECHEDIGELKQSSYHRGLACETCHGAAAAHVDEPDEFAPVRPSGRAPCLSCHLYLPSRPTGFPQVMADLHNPAKACMECHDPHEPTPPVTPSTCGACHASVARTKSVSHHAPLPCETCHEVPAEHRQNPRGFLAKKPTDRSFCGQCHGEGAVPPEDLDLGRRRIPRVDLASHGERYVCWQCHYPHFPESK